MIAKQTLRERVWNELQEACVARFPFPPHDRIPNFTGASEAASRLETLPVWEDADSVKVNPDAPQRPVRHRALAGGKTVYQAVPRLRDEKCFVELDPAIIDDYDNATTISGAPEEGRQVGPEVVESVDLIVCGSVAVDRKGSRVGKGEGYSDLEYAVLRELGLVDGETPVATTVHERQVREEDWRTDDHDVSMDYVATPKQAFETDGSDGRPPGLDWALLDDDQIENMPVLGTLRNAVDEPADQ